MKRIILYLLCISLFLCAMPVWAAQPGDIAGNYYYTDIKTYMKGAPISAYNIGGKTCIDAEILNWHYAFDVYWYQDTRTLDIRDKGNSFTSLQAQAGDTLETLHGQPGNVAGSYYHTDIVTYFNGKEIESYNIGGRTVILAEALKDYGYEVTWDPAARTLSIVRGLTVFDTDIGTITMQDVSEIPITMDETYGRSSYERIDRTLTLNGRPLAVEDPHYLYRPADVLSSQCLPVADILNLVGASIQWDDASRTLTANFDTSQPLPTLEPQEETPTSQTLTGSIYRIYDFHLIVNGEEYPNLSCPIPSFANPMAQPYRRDVPVYLYNGKVYITDSTAAEILGYSPNNTNLELVRD